LSSSATKETILSLDSFLPLLPAQAQTSFPNFFFFAVSVRQPPPPSRAGHASISAKVHASTANPPLLPPWPVHFLPALLFSEVLDAPSISFVFATLLPHRLLPHYNSSSGVLPAPLTRCRRFGVFSLFLLFSSRCLRARALLPTMRIFVTPPIVHPWFRTFVFFRFCSP